MNNCNVEGCDKKATRGTPARMCPMHFARQLYATSPCLATYTGMIARCYYRNNPRFHRYGGRGITVCDRWRGEDGYTSFITDMGVKPSLAHSLDRIDNDKGYKPSNCRWATVHEQAANQAKHKYRRVGVRLRKNRNKKKWEASLLINGKYVLAKCFETEEEALRARIAAEKKYLYGNQLRLL